MSKPLSEYEQRRRVIDAARLAEQGKCRCQVCQQVKDQGEVLILAFRGNVVLSICPTCFDGTITINKKGSELNISIASHRESYITRASSMADVETVAKQTYAKPKVEKTIY